MNGCAAGLSVVMIAKNAEKYLRESPVFILNYHHSLVSTGNVEQARVFEKFIADVHWPGATS